MKYDLSNGILKISLGDSNMQQRWKTIALNHWFLNCGPPISRPALPRELVRNAKSHAFPHIYWIRNSEVGPRVLCETSPPSDSDVF